MCGNALWVQVEAIDNSKQEYGSTRQQFGNEYLFDVDRRGFCWERVGIFDELTLKTGWINMQSLHCKHWINIDIGWINMQTLDQYAMQAIYDIGNALLH